MALAHMVLTSGRSIELLEVRLSSTYGGTLEGYPFQRCNDRVVNGLVRRAETLRPSVPDHPAGAFGPVELLPAATCVGSFTSQPTDPERDSVLSESALTVVWFQATPDIPSGEDADHGLRSICWDDVAGDFER